MHTHIKRTKPYILQLTFRKKAVQNGTFQYKCANYILYSFAQDHVSFCSQKKTTRERQENSSIAKLMMKTNSKSGLTNIGRHHKAAVCGKYGEKQSVIFRHLTTTRTNVYSQKCTTAAVNWRQVHFNGCCKLAPDTWTIMQKKVKK